MKFEKIILHTQSSGSAAAFCYRSKDTKNTDELGLGETCVGVWEFGGVGVKSDGAIGRGGDGANLECRTLNGLPTEMGGDLLISTIERSTDVRCRGPFRRAI